MTLRTPATRPAVTDLPDALAGIAAEADWDALQSLCDEHILAVEGDLAEQLFAVLTVVPEAELHARPRLMLAWVRAYHAAKRAGAQDLRPFLRHYTELGSRLVATLDVERETSLATLVSVGVAGMVALRAQGTFAEAEELGRRLSTRAAELSPLPGSGELAGPGWLALQRGLTRSLMGDYPSAVELYRHAYEQATGETRAAGTALNATANLAMVFAHLGHDRAAREWLERMRGFEPPSQRVRFLLTAGGTIAEGWAALDRYDGARVAECVRSVGAGAARLEVWPFAAALSVAHGVYFGDPAESLALLGTLRLSHAPPLVERGVAARVLARAHADLLIATGQGTRALRLIRDAGPEATHLTLPAARLRLLNGEYGAARALASRFSWDAPIPHRDLRQLLLIKALAAVRMGDAGVARDALRVLERVRTPAEALSLAAFSPADRAELAALGDLPVDDDAARLLAHARPAFPERVDLVELSVRERAVLAALGEGGTLGEIADSLVVSVNTVRTQVKSVYRKLRASNREDALMRAGELGLL